MSDVFTIKTISMTDELGSALKAFRTSHNVLANKITEKFGKASSYISKLENGAVKKIEGEFLVQLCNYICNSSKGLHDFVETLGKVFPDASINTKASIINIDELLYEHTVPSNFVSDITDYMKNHNISIHELVSSINANKDISSLPGYNSLHKNQWDVTDENNIVIRFVMDESYLVDLCSWKDGSHTIHRAVAKVILYNLYRLGGLNDQDAFAESSKRLYSYGIRQLRNTFITERQLRKTFITESDMDTVMDTLEPDAIHAYDEFVSKLKLATALTRDYGARRIKQMNTNATKDMGFYFAFMSLNLEALEGKSKEKKQKFLNELKSLIDKYSQDENTEEPIEIYD